MTQTTLANFSLKNPYYSIVKKKEIKVVGMELKNTHFDNLNFQQNQMLWRNFNQKIKLIPNRVKSNDWVKYGIRYLKDFDSKSKISQYYMTCVEVSQFTDSPKNFQKITIPDMNYIKMRIKGKLVDLVKKIALIYDKQIVLNQDPNNFPHNKFSPILHIERYDKRFDWISPESIIEIFIPLYDEEIQLQDINFKKLFSS